MNTASHFVGVGGGITLSFIAFSIVFLVLMALMGIIYANRYLAEQIDRRNREKTASKAPSGDGSGGRVAAAVALPDDGDIVAAITGALAMSLGRSVVVTGIRPVRRSGSLWKALARSQNIEGLD